jgi:hypothetical protein
VIGNAPLNFLSSFIAAGLLDFSTFPALDRGTIVVETIAAARQDCCHADGA